MYEESFENILINSSLEFGNSIVCDVYKKAWEN